MKITHEFTTSNVPLNSKPEGSKVGFISNNMKTHQSIETKGDLDDFVTMVTDEQYGFSWTPSVFKGARTNQAWQSTSMMALDFDQGSLSSNEAIKRLEELGIKPNIVYYTFSHREKHPRFRLILFLDKKITNLEERQFFQKGLFEIFPSADTGCADPAHFFYPGIEGFVYSRQEVDTLLLENIVDSQIISNDSGQTRSITAGSYLGRDYMVRRKVRGSINTINSGKENTAKYESWLNGQRKNAFDFDKAAKRVKIFKDFVEGQWLHHPQIFGLATSLYWVSGGLKFMKETMQKWTEDPSVETHYSKNNFNALKSVRKKQYTPKHLSGYSQYQEDWDQVNLIQAEKERIRGVQRTEQIQKTTLENAWITFKRAFNRALDDMDLEKIHLMKLPTGLGKSYLAKDTDEAVIAFPTHALKEEKYEERSHQRTAIMTPEVPEFESEELNEKIRRLYGLGFSSQVFKKIVEVSRQASAGSYSSSDRQAAKDYLRKLKEVYATSKTIFTTHQRALFSDKLPQDTVIFDEDIMDKLISVQSVKISDLQTLSASLAEGLFPWHEDDTILDLVKYLTMEIDEGEIVEYPSRFSLDISDRASTMAKVGDLSSNLLDLLTAKFLYKEEGNPDKIFYVNRNELPSGKKIIIMSATLNLTLYKELFGNRCEVTDVSDVETKGMLVQHTKKSYSRKSLKNSLQEANQKTAGKPTLTFMDMVDKLDSAIGTAYYGNCEGYDSLRGKSINICGTPHKNQALYLLMGRCLGMNVGPKDREFGITNVAWNGFRFSFPTFKNNERLQRLQLDLITSGIVQMVGRARLLREDCRVDLYSNLPLRQTDTFIHN